MECSDNVGICSNDVSRVKIVRKGLRCVRDRGGGNEMEWAEVYVSVNDRTV